MVKKAAQAQPNLLLRKARLERGWTQKDVAEKIGAPLDLNVTRWERGNARPSAFYVQKLCELFGKSATELGLLLEETTEVPASSLPAEPVQEAQYWNVPFQRNPFFIGHADLLDSLHHHMRRNRSAALTSSQALVGLGGIGKTQIAIEYAYRYRDHYAAVFWIRAGSVETLLTDYAALAFLLRLPDQESKDEMRIVSATKAWLAQHKQWLLILDNADDLSLLTEFIPTGGDGHLLLTTQAQATGRIAERFPVEKLELEESLLLLLRRAKLLSLSAPLERVTQEVMHYARIVVEELDGLPLALDQAAAYVEETGCSLAEYLQLYRKQRLNMLNRQSQVSADYPHTVASTWSLSFTKVEQANPAAADLLRVCAFLHPDAIPEIFLLEEASHLGASLAEAVRDPFSFHEMLQLLRRYSLVKRDADAKLLNLHRLVQVVLKESLSQEVRRLWAARAVRFVNAVFPEVSFDIWARCELCLSQVQVCAEWIEEYELAFPEAVRLLHQAGCYLRERGLYQRAEIFLQQALRVSKQALGAEHPDTASVLTDLGELYSARGDYEVAERLYQDAFNVHNKTLGIMHAKTATDLNNLGMLYTKRGKYAQAEPLLQQALSIREQVLGDGHSDVAEGLNNMAWVYYKQGKYTQAEPLYQRALRLREQLLGAEHPRTAESLDNLAIIYRLQGKYAQAEALHQRAFVIYEQVLGLQHPDTAVSLLAQALLQQAQQHYQQAQILYERAQSIFECALGQNHPRVAQTLYYLGQLATEQYAYEHAETLYLRSLQIREHALGVEHPDTVSVRTALAELQYAQQVQPSGEQ